MPSLIAGDQTKVPIQIKSDMSVYLINISKPFESNFFFVFMEHTEMCNSPQNTLMNMSERLEQIYYKIK